MAFLIALEPRTGVFGCKYPQINNGFGITYAQSLPFCSWRTPRLWGKAPKGALEYIHCIVTPFPIDQGNSRIMYGRKDTLSDAIGQLYVVLINYEQSHLWKHVPSESALVAWLEPVPANPMRLKGISENRSSFCRCFCCHF